MGEKKGFFSRLVEGLTKTRDNIVSGIDSVFHGFSKIDDEFYEELEEILIMGDLGVKATEAILDDLREKVKANHVKEPAECKQLLIDSIKQQMQVGETAYRFEEETSVVLVIGVNGVGKTTTIAKIASMMKLSGKVKVALVTSDTYRIAAVEQLKTYANILGVPLNVVYSSEEMTGIMDELKEYDLVLIDTAGRSHNNKEQKEDIHRLLETVPEPEREVFLVMSATTKYRDLVKISQAYSEITKYNLIFTKLDETDAIGNVFNIRMLTGAPLSYMTWGQNVPDDIGKVDAQKMAKQLLGGNS